MVFVTTPPHPASKARRMLFSDSVGGADERRNGFSNEMPVKVVCLLAMESVLGESGMRDPRSAQLIQFTPASLFHFVVIFFDCVQNSIEPRKENGSRGTGTPTLTPTMPALARSMT